MTGADDRSSLRAFLTAQRACALAVLDGISEEDAHRSVVPSGWTPAGMLAHLTGCENHWLRVLLGARATVDDGKAPTAGPPTDGRSEAEAPDGRVVSGFTIDLTVAELVDRYAAASARVDAAVAGLDLDAAPPGTVPADVPHVVTVGDVVLHLVEETARHVGHLDLARELLDGRTGLGPR